MGTTTWPHTSRNAADLEPPLLDRQVARELGIVAPHPLPESVTPYTLRHSGLSWALAAGIPAVDVARFGGTSVTMLERVYHHLLVSSAESARVRMDEFLVATNADKGACL